MPISLGQQSISRSLSWNLTIDSTVIVVTDSMSIGTLIIQLINHLENVSEDFSNHALWWPKANIWLKNTKWTLSQYGIQSDAHLTFTTMHKFIRLQLPDLRIISIRVDFSVSVFASVCKICKDLGIRHAEELSFLRLSKILNTNQHHKSFYNQNQNFHTLNRHNSIEDSLTNDTSINSTLFSSITPKHRSTIAINKIIDSSFQKEKSSILNLSKSFNCLTINDNNNLAQTPLISTKNFLSQLIRPISLIEKCKLNNLWFDSSKSLMEQNINENDLILLRFKYYSFYDLNSKFDAIRLNQLYEQAKWAILGENIDCTEEEMMIFAALQLQIQIQSSTTNISYDNNNMNQTLEYLQNSLLETNKKSFIKPNNHQKLNKDLSDYLYLFKSRRFTFKTFKRYWFILHNTQLTYYTNESQQHSKPIEKILLKGCEIFPDVNISSKKYSIRLMIPSINGMNEILIKCLTEKQYATWMAAFRLASKGQSINNVSYETERESILALLNMQIPSSNSQHTKFDIQPDNYVSIKYAKKYKTKQLTERILESHATVSNLDGTEAKLRYLKLWQSLPEFGISTFIVQFKNSNKKEELLGIAPNRILRMTMTNDIIKTWWISRMRSWNINWENKLITIEFDNEIINFLPLYGINSKSIHEFIGAYIFLTMRTTIMSDNNDPLQQETLFQQLTATYS